MVKWYKKCGVPTDKITHYDKPAGHEGNQKKISENARKFIIKNFCKKTKISELIECINEQINGYT
jgi:hypothetical protein